MANPPKILITGAGGLLGNALSERLAGDYRLALAGRNLPAHSRHETLSIDLGEERAFDRLPANPEAIVHLAQSSEFREFPDKAAGIFAVNTHSTSRLLEYGRKQGIKKFIFASTGGVYRPGDETLREDSPLQVPADLGFYAATKLSSELLVESYRKFFEIVVLRFFFIYGPLQKPGMLIPRLIQNVRNGTEISLQGDRGIRLNPIYVGDAADAVARTLALPGHHLFNIGGPETTDLRSICETIGELVGKSPRFSEQAGRPNHLVADIARMTNRLGKPKIGMTEGLKKMVDGA